MDPLLEQYRRTRDQGDFGRIVEAHIDAVYWQCVRQLHDRHLAEDATQVVFFMLARKANRLPRDTVLGGWLFTAARYACANARRSEQRRQRHEQKVARMKTETAAQGAESAGAERDQIERSLHDAIGTLGKNGRDAVVLRFFERRSMGEVGRQLGVSEQAVVARGRREWRRFGGRRWRSRDPGDRGHESEQHAGRAGAHRHR
jgi:RNA polymerase sigma factor (sigma-70 family)